MLKGLLLLLHGLGREPSIQLGDDQGGIFQQTHHLAPDQLVEQILANRVAAEQRFVQASPGPRADAAIVVNQPCRAARPGPSQGIAAVCLQETIPWTRLGGRMRRAAKRLISSSHCAASANVASETSGAGTGISIHSAHSRSALVISPRRSALPDTASG